MCCNYRVKLTGEGIVRASFPRREPSQTISRTIRIGPTKAKAGQAGVTGWAQLRKPRSVVVQIRLSVCQQGTPHRTGKCTLGQSGGASRLRRKEQDVVALRSLHLHSPTPPPAEEAEQGQARGEEGEGRGFGGRVI